MRPLLLHYHILKNGGSTVEEILRRSFGASFCSFDHADRDAEIKPAELIELLSKQPEAKAFSSHQIFYPVPRTPGFLFFDICFLRDPFDRIRSVYDYFRGKPAEDDPIRMLARQNTLGDFVRRMIEEMPWVVNDVQVNLLANGIVNDQPRGPQDLDAASRRMMETSFLGVVDRFEESLVAGEYAMRTLFPELDCAQQRVNDSAKPGSTLAARHEQFQKDLGHEVFSELSRMNAMDKELLDRARAEIRRRFENTPRAEARLAELEGRVAPARPRVAKIRKPEPPAKPRAFTRMKRALSFLFDFRSSVWGSDFRRLFDAGYYGGTLWNYVTRRERDPHPLFDTGFYLAQCAQPPRSSPLSHYLRHGGRPHPLFDPEDYLRRYPDVAASGMNALVHYTLHGAAEGRKPNPWFDPEFYFAGRPEAREKNNALADFLESAAANPHPLFDCESYLRAHPQTRENPLAAFLKRRAEPAPGILEFPVARLLLDEVELLIGFPGSRFDSLAESEQRAIHQASVAALLWRDARGQNRFLCEPPLRRFFASVRYDQLAPAGMDQ